MRNNSPTLDYITHTFVREPEWLKVPRAKGEELVPGMQISPYEGHLLSWLVKISGAKHVLEIGTFMGYSTLWMASALPKDGTITSLEFKHEHAELARAHADASPHVKQVAIVEGDGLAWLKSQPKTSRFDLIFIDAEKRAYANYLEEGLQLLNPRGWVVGDNTLLFGALAAEDYVTATSFASQEAITAMQKFNETLADPTRFESIMLPTIEGLTVARRKT